uniref:Uncharacterized protein n=1 Tax=Oryza barthii TaxID=65489 RepID=A0A0D3FQU5_9ORYZ
MAPVLLVVAAAWADVPAGSRVQVVQVACGARRPATTSMAVRCVGRGGGKTGPVLGKPSDDDDDDVFACTKSVYEVVEACSFRVFSCVLLVLLCMSAVARFLRQIEPSAFLGVLSCFSLCMMRLLRQIGPSVCFLGSGVKQTKLVKIAFRMAVVTAVFLRRVQANSNCADMSLQVSSLQEECARFLDSFVAGEEIAGHDAVRMLVGCHDKLTVVLSAYGGAGRDDVDEGQAPPVVVPPGGQIDTRLLDLFLIGTSELPTNWSDRTLVAQLTCSLYRAIEAVTKFIATTEKGVPLEQADAEGSHQSLHVASKAAGLTSSSSRSKDVKLRAILHEDSVTGVRPWFSLFGMSFSDLYDHFPESVWDICEDSPAEAFEKKEHKGWMQFRSEMNSRYNKAVDISFDDRFADSIVFDKTLYKYAILGCKVNADGIMNQGVISASERNKIIHALERIEGDIEIGKFKWRDGADIHTSIVEALADMIGDKAKDLAVESKYDSCLMILETWSKNSIDHIMTQLKQLQVALVLLAIKNDGVILGEREIEGTTCLESLLLRIVKVLDYDASKLRSYHGSISCSNDGVMLLRTSYPENQMFSKLSSMASFAESINNCIPNHLRQLLEKVLSRRNILLLTPNGETTIYDTVLSKFGSIEQTRHHGDVAISKCLNIGFGNVRESPQTCEIEDAKHYLFSSTKSVVEILDLSIQLVLRILFGMEKAQNSLPRGYHDVMRFTHFLTTKGIDLGTAYALVHLCLDKKLQPSELILDKHELKQIDFHCERAHYLLEYKGSIFGDSTDLDACKKMLKWCCKLHIDPAATISS